MIKRVNRQKIFSFLNQQLLDAKYETVKKLGPSN